MIRPPPTSTLFPYTTLFRSSNRTGNVEDELADLYRSCQGLGRDKYLAREQAVYEVVVQIIFIHAIDVAQHGFPFWSGVHHDQGDASVVCPMALFPQENLTLFGGRKCCHRV